MSQTETNIEKYLPIKSTLLVIKKYKNDLMQGF